MAGNSHRDLSIGDIPLVFGAGRRVLHNICLDHDVPAIDELCDTAKTRHVTAFLEPVDDALECRLWETSRGSPGVFQYEAIA